MKIDLDIPEGESGGWRVNHFTVSEEEARRFNLITLSEPGQGHRTITSGNYTKLIYGRDVVMSNTPAEIRDHMSFIDAATGDVLINGLGLGMCIKAILPKVDSITVVERSEDVINLVAPYYDDPKITIVNADALEYKAPKGMRFNAVWHDIWTFICSDNLKDMVKLHRKYGRRADWQGSWCRSECEYQRSIGG